MKVINSVYPNEEQMKGFLEPGTEGPICMVNLLKFKPQAEYADGRETGLTGREAYELYEKGITELLQQIGGYLGFVGDVERLALGEVEELWDAVALAPGHARSDAIRRDAGNLRTPQRGTGRPTQHRDRRVFWPVGGWRVAMKLMAMNIFTRPTYVRG